LGIKRRIYGIIEEDVSDSLLHKIFEVFIITLIILNIIAIIAESSVKNESILFDRFELFSVAVFTLEYLLRLWTADIKYGNTSGLRARTKFIFSAFGIVDIVAILPFYAVIFLPFVIDGRMFRMLRLLRLLRILKLYRFLDSFALIKKVIRNRRHELLITGFIALRKYWK
jgi:voltage-gated potassium channel